MVFFDQSIEKIFFTHSWIIVIRSANGSLSPE